MTFKPIPLFAIPFLLLLVACSPSKEPVSPKNNFIIIYTDDQQFMGVGYNNPKVLTPNIDRMAGKSLRFDNAHVAFSLCSPSRAALLTGRYGSHNGVLDFNSKNKLNDGELILPLFLKEKGYQTGLSGKWHIQQKPDELGFDYVSYFKSNGTYYGRKYFHQGDTLFPEKHVDEFGVEKSIAFIAKCQEAEQPFFLFHCPQTPHMNGKLIWDAKEESKQQYDVAQMPVPLNHLDNLNDKPEYLQTVRNKTKAGDYGYPDSIAIQEHTRDYYAVISELDDFLGKMFDYLEEEAQMNNTYIIFMSDNGWQLGDHGFTSKVLPYRASTHVPFWIYGPGIQAGSKQGLVSNLDVFPTILDLAGIELPSNLDGQSLKPLLDASQETIRKFFVYEGLGSYGGSQANLTVLSDQYRYIVTYDNNSLSKVNYRELYDLEKDTLERHNLMTNDSYLEEVKRLDSVLVDYREKVLQR